MLEENVVEQQDAEVEAVDYKALYEQSEKEKAGLLAKKNELLNETKQAKSERAKAAELAEQARQEQLKIAEKNGEYEKLFKTEKERREQLENELSSARKEQRNEKIDIAAMRIASQLAKGDPDKAELLKVFLASSISNVADEFGRVDEDTLNSVAKQFESDKRYQPLLGGNLSVGGGAPGSMRGAQSSVKEISRNDFEAMDHGARRSFLAKGGKLAD